MYLRQLWISDYRNHQGAELTLAPGLTVITGGNGVGKTNLLEAVAYLGTLTSFRGAPPEALVRVGCQRAVVRGCGVRAGREVLIEAEVMANGRGRVTLNRQSLRRTAELASGLVFSVFSPDDLELLKGGPALRRRYLDDLLVALHPRADPLRRDLERILRQRTALLRQVAGSGGGRSGLSTDVVSTLAVWDAKLVEVGEAVGAARAELVARLGSAVDSAYQALAAYPSPVNDRGRLVVAGSVDEAVNLGYDAPWRGPGLSEALAAAREDELRRGVCLVGPHRDDMVVTLGGLPARTHASQGEQRGLALALRLGAHHLVTDQLGEAPVLLLDDVFSELDPDRSRALVDHLPPGQALLTTTGQVPPGAVIDEVLAIPDSLSVPRPPERDARPERPPERDARPEQ